MQSFISLPFNNSVGESELLGKWHYLDKGLLSCLLHEFNEKQAPFKQKVRWSKQNLIGTFCNISALRGAAACHSNGFPRHRLDLPSVNAEQSQAAAQSSLEGQAGGHPSLLQENFPVLESCYCNLPSQGLSSTVSCMGRESKGRRGFCLILQSSSTLSKELLESHCSTMN